MANVTVPRNAGTGPGQIYVWETTLTVANGQTSATATSSNDYNGLVWMVTIDPGTLTASATIKGYETDTGLTTPPYFLNYTVPGSAVEAIIYGPTIQQDSAADAAVTGVYDKVAVAGNLRIDLASATQADSVTIRVYILG